MSEFEDKLNAILSSPEAMEQISALASSLGQSGGQASGEGEGGDRAASPTAAAPAGKEDSGAPDGSSLGSLLQGIDPGMLSRLMPLVREYQSGSDEKQALLEAMKPFLRRESQEKMEKAMRITRLSRVIRASMRLFREDGSHV